MVASYTLKPSAPERIQIILIDAANRLADVAAIVIDAAVQTTLVCGQQLIYNLHPEQRSRLNTLFIAAFFVGGAAGSAIASWAYDRIGWNAVIIIGVALALAAAGYWLTEPKPKRAVS